MYLLLILTSFFEEGLLLYVIVNEKSIIINVESCDRNGVERD